MTAIDIRAKVYCSLGTVISGNFADTYAQGSGLIFTRGSVEIKGIVKPDVGTSVQFAYSRDNYIARLPRTLRVLSSFADPFRKVTTVQLGCLLTFLESRKPPVDNPNSKDETNAPCYVYNRATLSISASYVVQQILTELGITSEAIPLTSTFSVDEFDLSPGFIQVLGDLIVSEGYIAFLDEQEILRFRDLGAEVGSGPLIASDQIIDLGPIGVGDLPGDSVIVRYSSLKLKPPDELEPDETRAKRMWEWEESSGLETDVSISFTDDNGNSTTVNATYKPYNFTATLYDKWDRAVEQFTYEVSTVAEVNNRWAVDRYRYSGYKDAGGNNFNNIADPAARAQYTVWSYKLPAPLGSSNPIDLRELFVSGGVQLIKNTLSSRFSSDNGTASACIAEPPDGYEEVLQQEVLSYISEAEVAGTLNVDSFSFQTGNSTSVAGFDTAFTGTIGPESRVITTYEKDSASGITRTRTETSLMYGKTTTGQQDLATRVNAPPELQNFTAYQNWLNGLVGDSISLRAVGTEVRIRTEREFGLERRPSQQDRNNSSNTVQEITESSTAVEWVTGSTESTNYIEFSMPYAPDDRISWTNGGGYTSTPSNASAKALRFGRIQNRLLLGNRSGLSLQLPAPLMPRYPFDPLYINAEGLVGQYRLNAATYSFDANGIVASADCLFWGGTGEEP